MGPTVLAVGYTLLAAWVAEADEPGELARPASLKSQGGRSG
jgi:hypothetical protein